MANCNLSDINHPRKTTLSRLITITQSSNGLPLNITGYTFYFTIKDISDNVNNDDSALFTKTWTTHSDPTNGQTILIATPTEMNIPENTYKYDIQAKSPTNSIILVVSGNFNILDIVTEEVI